MSFRRDSPPAEHTGASGKHWNHNCAGCVSRLDYQDLAASCALSGKLSLHGDNRMHYRLTSAGRQLLRLALAATLSSFSWAQQPAQQPAQGQPPAAPAAESNPASTTPVEAPQPHGFELGNYTKPQGYFPNPIAPYTSRRLPTPNLSNTARIEQLLQDGKLMLSMDDAVALALEN